jgi:hypothetical protein
LRAIDAVKTTDDYLAIGVFVQGNYITRSLYAKNLYPLATDGVKNPIQEQVGFFGEIRGKQDIAQGQALAKADVVVGRGVAVDLT